MTTLYAPTGLHRFSSFLVCFIFADVVAVVAVVVVAVL